MHCWDKGELQTEVTGCPGSRLSYYGDRALNITVRRGWALGLGGQGVRMETQSLS